MGSNESKLSRRARASKVIDTQSTSKSHVQGPTEDDSSNANQAIGSGGIDEDDHSQFASYDDERNCAPPTSDVVELGDSAATDAAPFEPLLIETALEQFQEGTGRRLVGEDENVAKQLLNSVHRIPFTVSLLSQLVRRGTPVSELLDRWNRVYNSLPRMQGADRIYGVEVLIELAIELVREADESQESLQLLSLCSMLPDGLHSPVFERLRSQFKSIDRAKDTLTSYGLASFADDRVLKTPDPIRHFVLERQSAQPRQRKYLLSIYFGIAQQLPITMDERFKALAAAAAPEMHNLSYILLTAIDQPSQRVVDAVVRLTQFSYWQKLPVNLAPALLPHLEPHPQWKARCLQAIGNIQTKEGKHGSAIQSLTTAARLFLETGERSEAAWCKSRAGTSHRLLGEYEQAQVSLIEAQTTYSDLGNAFEEARCRSDLGNLMREQRQYTAAIEHTSSARQTFSSLGKTFYAAQCSVSLSATHLRRGNLEAAAVELEAARVVFVTLGNMHHIAQSTRFLANVRRLQGAFTLAGQFLREAETVYKKSGDQHGLAGCALAFGYLRNDQGRRDAAIIHFRSAQNLFAMLKMHKKVEECRKWIERLESRRSLFRR